MLNLIKKNEIKIVSVKITGKKLIQSKYVLVRAKITFFFFLEKKKIKFLLSYDF